LGQVGHVTDAFKEHEVRGWMYRERRMRVIDRNHPIARAPHHEHREAPQEQRAVVCGRALAPAVDDGAKAAHECRSAAAIRETSEDLSEFAHSARGPARSETRQQLAHASKQRQHR
jgi:hypothetical protein